MTSGPGQQSMTELRYLRRRANRRVRKVRLVRGLARWVAFVGVQALLAALLVFAAGRALAGLERSSLLAFRKLEIEGAHRTPDAEIRRAVEGWLGRNLLELDLQEIRAAVERAEWVGRCTVKRVLPDTLRLRVTERRPGAVAVIDGRAQVVDTAGRIVGPTGPGFQDELPVLRGVDGLSGAPLAARLARGLAALERLAPVTEATGERISELDLSDDDRWTALTASPGPELLLDPAQAERNVARFLELRESIAQQVGPLDYVDLRWQDRIAVMPAARPAPTPAGTEP